MLIVTMVNLRDSFAIVTPTYLPDLARCELLAESLDRTNPDLAHYLIVDRRDHESFKHLENGKRRIIESESLVGSCFWRAPGSKAFWLSFKAIPARGWIIQQILKIASVDIIPEQTLIFCDSDMAFFRQFDRNDILVDGKIGLLDVDFVPDRRWVAAARRLLGVAQQQGNARNHVGNMICWNRETVKAMRERIESSTGLQWQIALARTTNFSEYMIYGIFVREVLGYNAVDHAPSTVRLVKASWDKPLTTTCEISTFFADFDPKTVAVMIHSKDGIDPARYRPQLERLWNS
jgi:hypothetical protein